VLGFGIALGAAVASKINAAPLAVLLPGAFLVRYFMTKDEGQNAEAEELATLEMSTPVPADETPEKAAEAETAETQPAESEAENSVSPITSYELPVKPRLSIEASLILLILGAFFSVLAFRIFQPYAFSGPGFFGVMPNPQWVQNISDQRVQASGDVDFPPALQWARRPIWYSGYHLVAWGLGFALGLDGLLLCLANLAVESHHALPVADLSAAGDDCSLVHH